MEYLTEYLNKKGKEGNYWIKHHIIMRHIREYEKEYGIKILLIVDEKK